MMWTKDKAYSIGETWRTWHLVPPTDRDDRRPSPERATIIRVTWDETYGTTPPPPVDKEATPPKPALVEIPAKVYSMLSVITTVLVVMLVLQFLRR
jgi:hypothetical protein